MIAKSFIGYALHVQVFALIVVIVISSCFFSKGVYSSDYYKWGPPIKFAGIEVDDVKTFNVILCFTFFHQIMNNIVNQVTYPWIINCVQDPKSNNLYYSRRVSMILVNLFAIYSELDTVILIAGITSQISFLVMIMIANVISVTVINYKYIYDRTKDDLLSMPDDVPSFYRQDAHGSSFYEYE
jgi:hypothetical protein